jgi:hypothetical protein
MPTEKLVDVRAAAEKDPNIIKIAFDGPPCTRCGNMTKRAGTCYICTSCGSTTGCG